MIPRHTLQSVLGLFVFAAIGGQATRAELIWSARFDQAEAGKETKPAVNDSGENETFATIKAEGDATLAVMAVKNDATRPAFMTGGALYVEARNQTQGVAPGAFQLVPTLKGKTDTGVLVLSFDWLRPAGNGYSLSARTRTASGTRSGKVLYLPGTPDNTPLRVTVVLNKSGASLALPGELGQLPADSLAVYRYDGTSFTGIVSAQPDVANPAITALVAGASISKLPAGAALAAWMDNLAVWNSPADAVAGTNVLRLAPGTVPVATTVR